MHTSMSETPGKAPAGQAGTKKARQYTAPRCAKHLRVVWTLVGCRAGILFAAGVGWSSLRLQRSL